MADIFSNLQLIDEEIDIEEEGDGMLLVGTPDDTPTAEQELALREFDANLASSLADDVLKEVATKIREEYDDDLSSRTKWMSTYQEGIKSIIGEDLTEAADARAHRNLTDVTHPLIAEAATQFQARAIGELFPAAGPVGTMVVGEVDEAGQEQAERVRNYMNYQVTEEMQEYFPDLDQLLFHLPLVGHCFKKSWMDPLLGRITSRFVQAEDFVVEGGAVDLETAQRYTHIVRPNKHDYESYVESGYYLELKSDATVDDSTIAQETEGLEPSPDNQFELLETHTYLELPGEDGIRPYVVTMDSNNDQIVSVRRNWLEEDSKWRKQVWFVSYKFLPGVGFYGFGLYHIIGGLGKAATGALRSLLDAAAFATLQGGFKLRGRVKSGEVSIVPGEFADLDAAVDDINKAIMPLPFKEPSGTMMQLLSFVVDAGKRFANTADMNISDANQNTPVGTTVALLEENARVFSAIHKRLHYSQKKEFKLIATLNGIYLPDKYPFNIKGGQQVVMRADFDSRVDVIPVSDPSTFSSTQRIAQAQAMQQMATAAPQFHDQYKAIKRMYDALRIPNYEEVLIDPSRTDRLDAVTENVNIMHSRPIKAFEDQDHMAHMAVLDDWFNRLPKQAQQMYMNAYTSHRAEHMALFYRTMLQAQMAHPLPELPNYSSHMDHRPVDAQTDKEVTEAAAIIVNQQPQPPIGPPIQQGTGSGGLDAAANDPMAAARMLAEAEAMSIQAKTQADIQAKQAKAQSDLQIAQMKSQMEMQIKQQDAMLDMQIEQIKIQTKARAELVKAQMKGESDQKKTEAEIQLMWAKAQNDMELAAQKSNDTLTTKRMEFMQKIKQTEDQHRHKADMGEKSHEHQMLLDFAKQPVESDNGE